MPTTAQVRVRRGPLAALLVLLGLLVASGPAAASLDLRAPAARLGSSRQGPATALLPPGARNPLDDELSGPGADPSFLPPAPGIVTERLWARPLAEARAQATATLPTPATASYRARAPPAA